MLSESSPLRACTIVAANYLAHARVLTDSFLEHHPDGTMTVFVLDDPDETIDAGTERFSILRPADVFADRREFHRRAVMYTVIELATAVKPMLLLHLLRESAQEIVYFDPDILITAPLDDVAALARQHSIVLTPHFLEPPDRQDLDLELGILVRGAFNGGFIAVSDEAHEFLTWWDGRLDRLCIYGPSEDGLFVDQVWLDLVSGYFDHCVLRDPGYNVAPWNTTRRVIERSGGRYLVDDAPLRFMHFSGFEAERPYLLTRWFEPPRTLLSEQPALATLCREYASRLFASSYDEWGARCYGYAELPNGAQIDIAMRRAYRRGLLEAEEGGTAEPPNPFEPGEADSFLRWLDEPWSAGAVLSRYLRAAWEESPDLQGRFPDALGADAVDFARWAASESAYALGRRLDHCPPAPVTTRSPAGPALDPAASEKPTKEGVLIVHRARTDDLSRVAARLRDTLVECGVACRTAELAPAGLRGVGSLPEGLTYDTIVLCLDAVDLPSFAYRVPREFLAERQCVCLWLDPAQDVDVAQDTLSLVDEVWVPDNAAAEAVAARTGKSAAVLPIPTLGPRARAGTSAGSGRDSGPLVLALLDRLQPHRSFDRGSAIEAYCHAFSPGSGASLILRVSDGQPDVAELERLRLAADRDDVRIVEGPLTDAERNALLEACDCYLSLDPPGSLSLGLLDAVALAKPIVAPPLSDILLEADAWILQGDTARAAQLLHSIADDSEAAIARAMEVRERLVERGGPSATAAFVHRRLSDLRRPQAATVPAAQPSTRDPAAGVNLLAPAGEGLGIAQAADQVSQALEQAGVPLTAGLSAMDAADQDGLDYDINLICVNADELIEFRRRAGPGLFRDRYTVGFWWWEVGALPFETRIAFDLVDEIWVGSRFVRDALALSSPKPVLTMPFPVFAPEVEPLPRTALGIGEESFLFLSVFDFLSILRRKNPLGLVEAFSHAFRPGEGPTLLVKTSNGARRPSELRRLRLAAAERTDIRIIDGHVDRVLMERLMASCNGYVSLHRSEGLGLTLAEAMAHGKPVIATAYGGNLEFMDEHNSFLVPFDPIPVGEGARPYPPSATWAEPDLGEAARLMRLVVEQAEEAAARGAQAASDVRDRLSPERAGKAMAERLAAIRAGRPAAMSIRGQPAREMPLRIAQAYAWLDRGPSNRWDSPSRLGFLGLLARRGLLRLLRPYLVRQRELDVAVVAALAELSARQIDLERQLDEHGHPRLPV